MPDAHYAKRAWRYQKALSENLHVDKKQYDYLILAQHIPSIYTLGRAGSIANIKFGSDRFSPHRAVRVERGGDVTWY